MKAHGWLTVLLCLMAVTAAAQGPPGDLRLEGDHWTAWDPPDFPPEGAEVYTVQRGDTLWDLAQQYFGDPYLWPQIWEANQYILDAHWIYPGDPLVIRRISPADEGIAGEPLAEAEPGSDMLGTTPADGEETASFTSRSRNAPVPLGSESDIYCSGYIAELEVELPFSVASSEYEFLTPTLDLEQGAEIKGLWGKSDPEKFGLGPGDIVYIDGGRNDGLTPGEQLVGIEPSDKVTHPLNRKVVGRFYHQLARIRILSVQESSAIGEITLSCSPLRIGTRLKPFEPEPVPLRRRTPMRPVNYPAGNDELESSATIVHTEDNIIALGAGHLSYIDRGSEDNVAPGDVYTIYRRGRRGFPPVVLGELAVLSVRKNTALGRILESRYTIFKGDALVLK